MSLPVLTAVTGAVWESELVGALAESDHGLTVVRRCVDLADLLSVASTGTARAVLLSADLRRLDRESVSRLGKTFVAASPMERTALLDDIAWPHKAAPTVSHGVAFFNSFRDLTSSGFWTSKMGIEDLQYIGNTFVPEWKGCPEEALKKLGVSSPSE